MGVDPHRLAEARSLAAHRVIAQRLRAEPELLDRARARVASWLRTGSVPRLYAERWQAILASSVDSIAESLCDPTDDGRALRQCTPFAGAISPRDRWRLWDEIREQLEGS